MNADIAEHFLAHIQNSTGCVNAQYALTPVEITGGYDTQIFHFRLDGVPEDLSNDLVLRVYPSLADKNRAFKEASVQNALANNGLPVPKVRMICDNLPSANIPFIVMDYVAGKTLLQLDEPESSLMLGQTHAMLHDHPVERIMDELSRDGFNELFLANILYRADESAKQFPWASKLIGWLNKYCPKESSLSICHRDFHKLNILQEQGHVTGILDWSGFAVMEPAYDVACTQISFLILAKHLTSQGDFDPVDLDLVVKNYRRAYAECRDLDETNLDYYLALRCTQVLLLAASSASKAFQHPLVVSDLCDLIRQISGVEVPHT